MKSNIFILLFVFYLSAFNGIIFEYFPQLSTYKSYIILLIDVIITFLGVSTLAYAPRRVIIALLCVIIFSIFNFLNSGISLIAHLNGLREITNLFFLFVFFYRLFDTGYQYYFNSQFKTFAIVFLVTQIPISIIQFLKYGASDNVGGTLGNGNSGILTFVIFILIYYLLEHRNDRQSDYSKFKYLFSISYFFIPVFLNETKITFILIPLMFATLINLKKIRSIVLASIFAGIFLLLFSNLYTNTGTSYDSPIEAIYNKDYLSKYLSGNDIGDKVDVPRFTKLVLGTRLLADDNFKLLFGQEYGAFKGGSTLEITPFANKYFWLLFGSRPYLFYGLITGGLTLLGMVIFLFAGTVSQKPYLGFENSSNGLLFFLCAVFLIMLFYNDALRYQLFSLVFIYVLFFSKFYCYPQVVFYEKKNIDNIL